MYYCKQDQMIRYIFTEKISLDNLVDNLSV
jgi:hypothetical protein